MKYFTLNELQRSTTAERCCIINRCNVEQQKNLESLVENVLDPARERYGRPVRVSSGYRNPALNRLVGGSRTSQHLKGEAADLCTNEGPEGNLQLARAIIAGGNFDQLILENVNGTDLRPQWVHVSWKRNGDNRHQILKKRIGSRNYATVAAI